MKKTIWILALVAMLSMTLVGCTGGGDESNQSSRKPVIEGAYEEKASRPAKATTTSETATASETTETEVVDEPMAETTEAIVVGAELGSNMYTEVIDSTDST